MEAVQIPTPSEDDSDNVVTALETAAIFGAKGDAPEAVRWLKRAAESAGADGRDGRALALARMAADLAEHLSGVTETNGAPPSAEGRERRLPKPPPRPLSSVRPPPPSARHKEGEPDATPLSPPSATPMPTSVKPKPESARPPQVAASGSMRPSYSPSPPKVVTSVRPGPPSQAPEPRLTKSSYVPAKPSEKPAKPGETSARASQTPAPAAVQSAVSKPSGSLNGASKSVAPRPSAASNENGARAEVKAKPVAAEAKAPPAEETPAPPAVAEREAETTAAPPAVALKHEAPAKAAPAVSNAAARNDAPIAKSEAPAAAPVTSSEPPRALGRRQAARVSIEPSSGSKRFYVLRVLEEGEAVPDKGLEALLVLTDPNARFPES